VSAITGRLLGWLSGDGVIDASGPIFPATAPSRADQVSLECENFRTPIGIARTELTDDADQLGANFLRHENRCLERLMLAKAMSAMNRMLRTSEGTSIIVGRLDCAKAENEECNRGNGATGAVNSENVQDLSLRTSQLRASISTLESLYNLRLRRGSGTSQAACVQTRIFAPGWSRPAYGAGITLNSY
jgi:hypothetical protein